MIPEFAITEWRKTAFGVKPKQHCRRDDSLLTDGDTGSDLRSV